MIGLLSALTLLASAPAADAPSPADARASCAAMAGRTVGEARVIAAEPVSPSPEWTSPTGFLGSPGVAVRVPFCRVRGVIEREIGFELWLPPAAAWNGRYLGVGNGGDAGFINYGLLKRGVTRGFASASTDTGHLQSDPHWALGHPERLENYGFRAHHLLAVHSKLLIAAYYGRPARWTYFLGCSGGGAQGMNEVQRYAGDYNGIISGASGTSFVPLSVRFVLGPILAARDPAGALTPADWKRVADAAVAQCDALDGLRDGVISDPRACRFDPASTPGLTPAQGVAARRLVAPLVASDGERLYPGLEPGAGFFSPPDVKATAARVFGEWLHQDPAWTLADFDPTRDYEAAEADIAGLRFSDPDLTPFARVGGKLITYIGWADPIVPPQADIDYYEAVSRTLGPARTQGFFRLYLAPGMGHCAGGAGADAFGQAVSDDPPVEDARHDLLTAMTEWVEQGRAPDTLIATKLDKDGAKGFTRPLCPYPQTPAYGGVDPAVASSFRCVAPRP